MPGESAAMTRTWRVGWRTCTLTAPQTRGGQVAVASIEWSPNLPRRLSRRELRRTAPDVMRLSPICVASSGFEARYTRYDTAV